MKILISDAFDPSLPGKLEVLSRELTKLYEEVVRGTLGTIDLGTPRGEYVIVVAGRPTDDSPADDDAIRAALRDELAGGATKKDAIATVARRMRQTLQEVLGAERMAYTRCSPGASDIFLSRRSSFDGMRPLCLILSTVSARMPIPSG